MNRLGNIGFLFIGIASCMWAFAYYIKSQQIVPPKSNYQLLQLGDMVRNQFLVDKNTGRIWNKICTELSADGFGCKGEIFWSEMYVENLTPEDSKVAKWHRLYIKALSDKMATRNTSKPLDYPQKR